MKVLIAEDDPTSRKLLETALRKWGHQAIVAQDGEEAWDTLQSDDIPKLAILDWMMPKMSGIELCKKIRKTPGIETTYIILLTSKGKKEHVLTGFEAGVDDYLKKPFDRQELKARIDVGERIVMLQGQLKKRAETAEERYQNIFENAIEGIFQISPEGGFIVANPSMLRIFGFDSIDELENIGPQIMKQILGQGSGEPAGDQTNGTQSVLADHELIMTNHAGEDRWISLNVHVVQDQTEGIDYYEGSMSDITERKLAEEEIHNIFELSPDLLAIIDIRNLIFKKVNPAFTTTFGYSEEELLSTTFTDLLHPRDLEKTLHTIQEAMEGEEGRTDPFESRLRCNDESFKWIAWRSNSIAGTGISYSVGRDITDKKHAEEERKRRLMKFRLEEGNIYLEMESVIDRSGIAFNDLLNVGFDGLVISRTPEKEVRKAVPGSYEFCWISGSKETNTIPPDPEELLMKVSDIPRRSAIFLDRLDNLIVSIGFERIFSFVQSLKDLAYLNDHIIILSADPKTLDNRERAIIAKEAYVIESMHKSTLSDDHIDMLRFIQSKQDMNVHVTYGTIIQGMIISRPTTRKRVGELVYKGYLTEELVGKTKRFTMTGKARQIFSDH